MFSVVHHLFIFSRLSFHPLKLECHLFRAAFISSLLICLPCANLTCCHLPACFVCMYVIIADARFRRIKSSPASIHPFPPHPLAPHITPSNHYPSF
ncbi:hypothetical protein BC826DRAFT_1052450 [Russula brevipes]|nr:hypothetical protein BC826DRAFT_1052450 [Russula brevipes]